MDHVNCNCVDCWWARGCKEVCPDCGGVVGEGCPVDEDELFKAILPFASNIMEHYSDALPDDTMVRLVIEHPNTSALTVSLRDLRDLWSVTNKIKLLRSKIL